MRNLSARIADSRRHLMTISDSGFSAITSKRFAQLSPGCAPIRSDRDSNSSFALFNSASSGPLPSFISFCRLCGVLSARKSAASRQAAISSAVNFSRLSNFHGPNMPAKKSGLTISTLVQHPDHVRAIGMISIENANLEALMALLFSRATLISMRVGTAIYLTPKSAIARIEIFQAAVKAALEPHRAPERRRKRLKEFLKKSNRIAERAKIAIGKRHQIIHDGWGVYEETNSVIRFPSNRSDERLPVDVRDLNRLLDEMRTLTSDIEDLAEQFKRSHPLSAPVGTSSRDKTRE
jgi:hypothetical protein